jgi:hypothetical protein
MKAAAAAAAAAILVIAFLAPALSFAPAFAQAQNELQFSPEVPTKKSNILLQPFR